MTSSSLSSLSTVAVTSNDSYEAIVLGPGGANGFLHLGALFSLESKGLLKNVHTYVGVSIGAVISLLMVCGYSASEIVGHALTLSDMFVNTKFDLQNLTNKTGLLSMDPLNKLLCTLIREKFGTIPTLKELHNKTQKRLITVTCNLSKHHGAEYFDYISRPNTSIIDAVLMSCNIPFIFTKYKYDGGIYIDGAFVNPYPVDIVDDGKTKVLGLYIEGEDEKTVEDSYSSYFSRIIHSPQWEITRKNKEAASKMVSHIRLISSSHDTMGVSLSIGDKVKMIFEGLKTCESYLNKGKRKKG